MSERKWTPGPWVAVRNSAYWEVNPANGAGDGDVPFTIGDVCASSPGNADGGLQKANAHLIAAAPDLYDALQEMVDYCNAECGSKIYPGHQANQALAKARGETQ